MTGWFDVSSVSNLMHGIFNAVSPSGWTSRVGQTGIRAVTRVGSSRASTWIVTASRTHQSVALHKRDSRAWRHFRVETRNRFCQPLKFSSNQWLLSLTHNKFLWPSQTILLIFNTRFAHLASWLAAISISLQFFTLGRLHELNHSCILRHVFLLFLAL